MSSYSLTYPQLMTQALSSALPESDLKQLRAGHEFAKLFADGIYRAQDVPLLNHLVRSTSILLAERQPIEVLLCGMLHAAYILRYFDGGSRQRLRQSHRAHVRASFGAMVDDLVWDYSQVDWYGADSIEEHRRRVDDYPKHMRRILTVRLANDLEDSLDLAAAYAGGARADRFAEDLFGQRIELARQLSLDRIAGGLLECADRCRSARLPDFAILGHEAGYELPPRRLWQASWPERMVVGAARRIRRLTR